MEFNDDGTFSLIPQSLKDPTRKYKGTWKLKECTNCDSKFPSRGIVIEFDNRGWITDGNSNNGFKETGYGTILKGDIRQNYKNEWEIRFESNSSGLIYDSNAGSSGEFVNGDKSFSRQLEDK